MAADRPTLGILAGGGRLPGQVAAAARAAGRGVFLVGLEGFADPAVLAPWPHEVVRILAAGRIIAALARAWLPGSRVGRAGAAAFAARSASGCRGCAHSGPHRPRRIRRRRWVARGSRAGVCRGRVPRLGAHEILNEALGPCRAAVARRSGCGGDGGHSPRHRRCPRARRRRCRSGLRGAAGDGAGGRGSRGHRCDAGALRVAGAAGTAAGCW